MPVRSVAAPLQVAAVCIGGRWRLSVSGELDLDTGRLLMAAVAEVADARPGEVELDLAGVSFVDSAGWQAVGTALDLVDAAGGRSSLGTLSPAVDRLRRLHPPVLAPAC